MIAEVVLNAFSGATDNIYHYIVPENIREYVRVGVRVFVPFGRGNKLLEAYVLSLVDYSDYDNLKEIDSIEDTYSYFDEKAVELIKFMVHRYFSSYISAIKAVIPVGVGTVFKKKISLNTPLTAEKESYIEHSLRAKEIYEYLLDGDISYDKLCQLVTAKNLPSILSSMQEKGIITITESKAQGIKDTLKKYVSLNVSYDEATMLINTFQKKAPARARCIEILSDCGEMLLRELIEYAETSKSVVDYLEKNGYVSVSQVIERDEIFDVEASGVYVRRELTVQQKNVCDSILESINASKKKTYLLNGVTGSGKTEVYLELIENTVNRGKQAVFLVPEISLTPQMVSQVNARFGDRVAVMHSSLTQKQRYEQWKRIKDGDVDIAVGARSAVFAPFDNIGLFIVDEEHENTYKSEFSPKYNAVEIARFRARQHSAVVLLASATPLVESTFRVHTGKYEPLFMPDRINKARLPRTIIADMREEMSEGNMSIFSRRLIDEISVNLQNGEQTILFLNRRGFASFVSCRSCGYVPQCPNCNVSLTYHKSIEKMVCHYCDYAHPVFDACPECSSKYIKPFGIGTERVADEVQKFFPEARIIRMDADTTSARHSHEQFISAFRNGDADILIGTQMITKGLDFKNVTLVGIIAADMSLNLDDYRAAERTFDLITQVIGRAGRGDKDGRAVIQTYNPENETIVYASNQDYNSFYNEEIELRKILVYPPFCEFINFIFTSERKEIAKKTADVFRRELVKQLEPTSAVVYMVGEAPLYKLNGKYRYRFLVKTRYSRELYEKIYSLYKNIGKGKGVSQITIDVNPSNMH